MKPESNRRGKAKGKETGTKGRSKKTERVSGQGQQAQNEGVFNVIKSGDTDEGCERRTRTAVFAKGGSARVQETAKNKGSFPGGGEKELGF